MPREDDSVLEYRDEWKGRRWTEERNEGKECEGDSNLFCGQSHLTKM